MSAPGAHPCARAASPDAARVWVPGVQAAAIIVFSLAASSYISPHYLGGAAELTLTTLIGEFILATYNSPLAGAAAILLLLVMITCMAGLVLVFRPLIRP